MTERESFVASMRDNPADDTARLVFADWLDERGEHDRAELIRVQVARARLNPRLRLVVESLVGVAGYPKGFVVDLPQLPPTLPSFPFLFDAAHPTTGEVLAVGCECREVRMHGMRPRLIGRVTGTPCPVRPEADALDERAAALMLKIPFGEFAPTSFVWHIDAGAFDQPQDNGAVLVRRGFAEHVRCSWEDWVRWADWFRANHPCERVTLTTMPQWEFHYDGKEPNVTATWKGGGRKVRCELPAEFFRGIQVYGRVERVTQEFCREQWRSTSFALPGQHHEMSFVPLAPLLATTS